MAVRCQGMRLAKDYPHLLACRESPYIHFLDSSELSLSIGCDVILERWVSDQTSILPARSWRQWRNPS